MSYHYPPQPTYSLQQGAYVAPQGYANFPYASLPSLFDKKRRNIILGPLAHQTYAHLADRRYISCLATPMAINKFSLAIGNPLSRHDPIPTMYVCIFLSSL